MKERASSLAVVTVSGLINPHIPLSFKLKDDPA
jgi:hypothetical protein